MDVVIENLLLVELQMKRLEEVSGIHEAQLMTCMKSAGMKVGLRRSCNVMERKDIILLFVL